jgi:hypothetical protein
MDPDGQCRTDLDEYIYEAPTAGASGFVLEGDPPEQPLAAIHSPRVTLTLGDDLLSA